MPVRIIKTTSLWNKTYRDKYKISKFNNSELPFFQIRSSLKNGSDVFLKNAVLKFILVENIFIHTVLVTYT